MASTSRVNEENSLAELTSMSISVQRKKRQPQQRKMTRHALSQYITDTYGTGKTESEKEFVITLNKYGDFSLGLLVVYILSVWLISTTMATALYKSFDKVTAVRCKIPALERCFNFSQVLNISVENKRPTIMTSYTKQYCRYDVRDYADLTKRYSCNYSSIISEIENTSVIETRPCEKFVVSCNVINPITYYEWFCDQNIRYQIFIRIEPHAELFLTGLLTTTADLFGRKRAFIVGSSLHMMGIVITVLPSQWCLYVGSVLAASRDILLTSLYVLTLELCSNAVVLWMGALMSVVYPFPMVIRALLDYTIFHWIYKQLAIIAMSLVIPFGMWYITESPRWLMFTGNKPGAWKALMEWDSDVQPDDDDMNTPMAAKPRFKNVLRFFCQPLFRKRIITCSMLWFLYYISKYHVGPVIVRANDTDHVRNFLIGISLQFVVALLGNITAIKYGRKRTIFTLYCISTPLNAIIFMQNMTSERSWVLLILQGFLDSLKISEFFILLYYTSEMFPTPYRVTALNICVFANEVGYILQDQFYEIFRPTSQGVMYMPIFLASVACMLIVYFLPETKNEGLPDTPRDAIYLTTAY